MKTCYHRYLGGKYTSIKKLKKLLFGKYSNINILKYSNVDV